MDPEQAAVSGTYFDILGVPEDCEDEDLIQQNYRKLAMKYHPDRVSDPEKKKEYTFIMSKINQAYDVLKNPETRHKYRQDLHNPLGDEAGDELFHHAGVAVSRLVSQVTLTDVSIARALSAWAQKQHLTPIGFHHKIQKPHLMGPPIQFWTDILHVTYTVKMVYRYEGVVITPPPSSLEESRNGDIPLKITNQTFDVPLACMDPQGFFTTTLQPILNDEILMHPQLIESIFDQLYSLPCTMVGEDSPVEAARLTSSPPQIESTTDTVDVNIPSEMQDGIMYHVATDIWGHVPDANKNMAEIIKTELQAGGNTIKRVEMEEVLSARDLEDFKTQVFRVPVLAQVYKYHGSRYVFLVNLGTGECAGSRPFSMGKVLATAGGILVGGLFAKLASKF